MSETALDVLLSGALLLVAWRALTHREAFTAVVLFMVVGLLMALAWVRLGAPDIALAEAAIGAGITGALLLDAAAQLGTDQTRPSRGRVGLSAAVAAVAGIGVAAVALTLRDAPPGLAAAVAERLPESGVQQPVTAVLLDFRGYDTWLELGVLLAAVLALLALRRTADLRDVAALPPDPLLARLTALLVPVMILAGGYLLWLGTHAAGGAFQAGALLAGAGVLLRLAGTPSIERAGAGLLYTLVVSGFAAFLLTATALLLAGQPLLAYPDEYAYLLIVLIECAAAVAVGSTLAVLVAGAMPSRPTPGDAA